MTRIFTSQNGVNPSPLSVMSNRFALLANARFANVTNVPVRRDNTKNRTPKPVGKGPMWVAGQEKIASSVLEKPVESVSFGSVYHYKDGLDEQRSLLAGLNATAVKQRRHEKDQWCDRHRIMLGRMYRLLDDTLADSCRIISRETFDTWVYRMTTGNEVSYGSEATTGGKVGYPPVNWIDEVTQIDTDRLAPQAVGERSDRLVTNGERSDDNCIDSVGYDDLVTNEELGNDFGCEGLVYDLVVELRELGEEFGQRVLRLDQTSEELLTLLRLRWE